MSVFNNYLKSSKENLIDVLAFFLLIITHIILLFKSHNYPLLSNVFIIFTLTFLIISFLSGLLLKLASLRPFLFVTLRCIVFILGVTFLISRTSNLTFLQSSFIAIPTVILLRDKINSIIIISTVSIILSSFIIIAEKVYPDYLFKNDFVKTPKESSQKSSPFFHLIFDEAMGISAFSKESSTAITTKDELIRVLTKHSLTIIKNAYSSSMWTQNSLSHVVNLADKYNAVQEYPSFSFESNALFETIHKHGYQINVFQSSYLDFCSSMKAIVRNCYSYPIHSLSYFIDNDLDKLALVAPYALKQLDINQLSAVPKSLGFTSRIPIHLGSLAEKSTTEALIKQYQLDSGGNQYYFVHFLYPHHDFFQTGECKTKPNFDEWGDIGPFSKSSKDNNLIRISSQQREKAYQAYYSQYKCFIKKLDALLTDIFKHYPDASIIIHGDHSSRISTKHINDGLKSNFELLNKQNLLDLYPTLLAFKDQNNEPGLLDCTISLLEFLQHAFLNKRERASLISLIIRENLFPNNPVCSKNNLMSITG